jgi:hypothetical protein
VRVGGIAEGINDALSVDPARLKQTAARLVALCRDTFQTAVSGLGR